uniref:fimbria major subunit n=1 Tax=Alloprevotella sp. TaxID=1872471 RepID=UPI003FF1136A
MFHKYLTLLFPFLLTACADTDGLNNGSSWNADSTGYVALNICLPATGGAGMRASSDGTLTEGEKKEYAVNDATLVLFAGNNEEEALFEGAYMVPARFTTNGSTSQISVSSRVTRKIRQVEHGNVYAYVILNGIGTGVVDTEDGAATDDIQHTALTVKTKDGTVTLSRQTPVTFRKFQQYVTDATDTRHGFLMTNAPLYNTAAGTHTVQTLSLIAPDRIKLTPEEAREAATEVYVERVMAKVSLVDGREATKRQYSVTNDAGLTTTYNVELKNWVLDNTNRSAYLTRHATTADFKTWAGLKNVKADATRFIGATPVGTGDYQKFVRTHWAKDVNYDKNHPTDINRLSDGNEAAVNGALGADNPQYCFENTFDVERMTIDNTTRAILAAQFVEEGKKPADLYLYDNDTTTLANVANMKADITAAINAMAVVKARGTASDVAFEEVNAHLKRVKSFTIGGVSYAANATDAAVLKVFNTVYSNIGDINIYKDGMVYYQIRVKHFGDDLTPWNRGEAKVTTTDTYPVVNRDANYLGRYGILRNNWYELNVATVNRLGYPAIPPLTDKPDDLLNEYISVIVNIQPWVKKGKEIVLQ